jgi:DNA-binding transcriptional MerR regulator
MFDLKQWPRVLWQNPLLFLVALLLGAVIAFTYSYAPLHRAKDWKIGYLEERLGIRTNQAKELELDLHQARAALEGTPSGEELGAVRAQLNEAMDLADAQKDTHKKKLAELARKLESAERSRNKWKSRYEEARPAFEAARRSTEAEAMHATTDPLAAGAPAAPAEAAPTQAALPGPAALADEPDSVETTR